MIDDHHHLLTDNKKPNVRLYKRRWVTLLLFSFLSMSNAILWITYSPIAYIVSSYYNISLFVVNFLSLVYMIVYIPGIFLASWIIDNKVSRYGSYLFYWEILLGITDWSNLECIAKHDWWICSMCGSISVYFSFCDDRANVYFFYFWVLLKSLVNIK